MGDTELKIKYEHIRYAWIIYTCITLILCVFTFKLSWSILVFLWLIVSELGVTFLVNYLNHTEQRLSAQAKAAKKAEKSKTDFLANMSHEIRTPMNAIVGMCELTLREPDISKNVRENCYNIKSSGASLLSIVNDILDFSKIESGKMEIINDEFNIAMTLNDVVNMSMARKGSKELEMLVQVDTDIPKGLIGDELRIRQIIINLMTNAIKYTREGSVTLKVSKSIQDYGVNLNISVIDTGIGISEENLEKLFTSFQQVDTRKNRAVEGTGLGLAISKKLVTSMGGFINVTSKLGKGSEFKVTLPLEVKNSKPFITVKEPEKLHVISYFNPSKFTDRTIAENHEDVIKDFANRLNIDFYNFEDFDTFSAVVVENIQKLTHCFIGKEEYLENRTYFNELANRVNVILIQDKNNSIEPPNKIRCIYKPFYALSAASVLNNESIIEFGDTVKAGTRFIAPKAKILIVDDNEINREVSAGLLKPYKMQIVTADSGKAAIQALKSKDFDLVFMDHMMPEMDGVECTKIIREMDDKYYKKVPIIALTANAVNGVKEMFIRSGFNDFMAKPIELAVLDRMVKNWLPDKLLQKPGTEEPKPVAKQKPKPEIMECHYFSPEHGLYYTGGNEETYLEMLGIFVRSGKEKIDRISELFAKKDWKNYTIEVHALKSSSLSLGADSLSELAKKMEMAGKARDYVTISNSEKALIELYKNVINECAEYLRYISGDDNDEEEIEMSFKLEIEESMLQFYIDDIIAACDLYDLDEIVRICQEAAMFSFNGRSLKKCFETIINYAEDFEYEKARDAAENLISTIQGQEAAYV
jgi:signal transduction histidine kinase/CheY-like chemotaxis protein